MSRLAAPLRWVVVLCIPILLIGTGLRLVLLPAYLQLEYRMPHFPIDSYGFSTAERLHWATLTWQYLISPGNEGLLAELEFADGSPLFNPREVSHMADVKAVVQVALAAWIAGLAVLALAGIVLWRSHRVADFRAGIRDGGWLTIGLAGFIGLLVALGILVDPSIFWEFFTVFHAMFFDGDSWLFAYSDTLIRLFPIRFWQDTFLFAAVVILAGGVLVIFGARRRAPLGPTRD